VIAVSGMSKTVEVQYFAILREQRGLAKEKVSTAAATAAQLYDELRARHGFTLESGRLRVAVNDDFAPWQAPLRDGDRLVFIPPVAGG
jgi:molybdopterin converting factor subunit 1